MLCSHALHVFEMLCVSVGGWIENIMDRIVCRHRKWVSARVCAARVCYTSVYWIDDDRQQQKNNGKSNEKQQSEREKWLKWWNCSNIQSKFSQQVLPLGCTQQQRLYSPSWLYGMKDVRAFASITYCNIIKCASYFFFHLFSWCGLSVCSVLSASKI